MTLDELRRKLGDALADPRRRQLAHIAVLDIAMAASEALEAKGASRADVEAATEAISAYLKGESDDLPGEAAGDQLVADTVMKAVTKVSQEPSFAPVFR